MFGGPSHREEMPMRALILGVRFMTTALAAEATAADPPKKEKPLKAPYVERISVKIFVGEHGLEFLKPHGGIGAYHKTMAGKDCLILNGRELGGTQPVKAKSLITDSAGIVWLVTADTRRTETEAGMIYPCPVVKAPAPKNK